MTIYCSKCGKEIPEYAKYCPYCGEEVIFNRNNPDAKEVSLEDLNKEDPKEEVVTPEVVESTNFTKSEDVEKYEREILECMYKRKVMVTFGIIISAIFLVMLVVFAVLYVRGVAIDTAYCNQHGISPVKYSYLTETYQVLMFLADILLNGGAALIVLGAVVNTTKIRKRQQRIKEIKNK